MHTPIQSSDALLEYARQFASNTALEPEAFLARHGIDNVAAVLPALILLDMQLRYERGMPLRLENHLARFRHLLERSAKPDTPVAQTQTLADDTSAALDTTVVGATSTSPPKVPNEPGALPGILASERFEPIELLGEGGFGSVYLARDRELHRLVACKLSHVAGGRVEDYIQEARILASLDHPHIVPVYDVMRTRDARVAIITKYIPGSNLRERLREKHLGFSQAADLLATIAEALHYAHRHGVFHRDIKPANILIDESGAPYVGDFGLALARSSADGKPRLSGTPAYMSPEQARAEGNLVDGRSDIYSLGVVMYELLTGSLPYTGTGMELLERVIRQEAMPPRTLNDQIPTALEQVCMKALAKHISDRYPTALDMARELRDCQTYTPAPIDVSGIELPESLGPLQEQLAENNHDVWARQRISEGWEFGNLRDDVRKVHPDLVPYQQLSEGEKNYDRQTVEGALKAILKLGFRIEPPSA